jgi:predicted murein hydrolase (TIGR00659 family)
VIAARLLDLWHTLQASPLLWLTVTLLTYQGARWIARRTGSPWLNPVLTSILAISALLLLTDTPYDAYFSRASFIHFLLGPATVALAVPLAQRAGKLWQALGPLVGALAIGSLTAIFSAVGLGWALGATPPTLLSLAPKSVTTPIAMGISEKLGGIPSLTAILVILTGIIGAVSGSMLLDRLRIRDHSVRGFAIGLASHGIGTARAFEMDQEAGAFSGLGMGLNGMLTALLIPILAALLGWKP